MPSFGLEQRWLLQNRATRYFAVVCTLSPPLPFRLTVNKLYTKCSHGCLYMLEDLAWPKEHFCLVCINGTSFHIALHGVLGALDVEGQI